MAAFILGSEVFATVHAGSDSYLRIAVVFTDFEETGTALKAAAKLSLGLRAAIDLIVPQVVPFPLPLAEPPVPTSFTLRRLDDLASAANVEPDILVYLCRDVIQTLAHVLKTYSVIMVGSKKRRLAAKPKHLAKALRRKGLPVILATCD